MTDSLRADLRERVERDTFTSSCDSAVIRPYFERWARDLQAAEARLAAQTPVVAAAKTADELLADAEAFFRSFANSGRLSYGDMPTEELPPSPEYPNGARVTLLPECWETRVVKWRAALAAAVDAMNEEGL